MAGAGEGHHLELSAHHVLCVHGFRGMGYSPGFVAGLTAVVDALRADPGLRVRVRVGSDQVCRACPSLTPGGCARYGRGVVAQDARVAARLGLAQGEVHAWAALQDRVRARVAPGDLAGLCRGCPWLGHGVCAQGIADLAAGRPTPAGPAGAAPGDEKRPLAGEWTGDRAGGVL